MPGVCHWGIFEVCFIVRASGSPKVGHLKTGSIYASMKKQRLSRDPSTFGSFMLLSANPDPHCVSKPSTLTRSLEWRSFISFEGHWDLMKGSRYCSCLFREGIPKIITFMPGSVQILQSSKVTGLSNLLPLYRELTQGKHVLWHANKYVNVWDEESIYGCG